MKKLNYMLAGANLVFALLLAVVHSTWFLFNLAVAFICYFFGEVI